MPPWTTRRWSHADLNNRNAQRDAGEATMEESIDDLKQYCSRLLKGAAGIKRAADEQGGVDVVVLGELTAPAAVAIRAILPKVALVQTFVAPHWPSLERPPMWETGALGATRARCGEEQAY